MAVSIPGEWVFKEVLGPVLGEIGEDVKKLYSVGRDKIIMAAHRKIKDKKDGKKVNLRVTRDILWNGSFTDESISAEYFGGILASSRSNDGKNDDVIHYSSILQTLSSKQIHLHYIIYSTFNKLLVDGNEKEINVMAGSDLEKIVLYYDANEILISSKINFQYELPVLYKQGLIKRYSTKITGDNDYYFWINPTTMGVLLYLVAHNAINSFNDFSKTPFENFKDITLPKKYGFTIKELKND